jgi:phage baseplate assembly protein W
MTPIPPADPGATVSADEAVRRRRLLGVGLRADPVDSRDLARDVSLRRTPGGVDLDVVEGLDALAQDLAVSLTTLRGSDPFNARFGFLGLSPLAEQTSPAITREAVRSAVAQVVAADPRVRRIVDLTATTPSPGGRVLHVRVSFDTISGDPATVAVSGLASGATFGLETPS